MKVKMSKGDFHIRGLFLLLRLSTPRTFGHCRPLLLSLDLQTSPNLKGTVWARMPTRIDPQFLQRGRPRPVNCVSWRLGDPSSSKRASTTFPVFPRHCVLVKWSATPRNAPSSTDPRRQKGSQRCTAPPVCARDHDPLRLPPPLKQLTAVRQLLAPAAFSLFGLYPPPLQSHKPRSPFLDSLMLLPRVLL